MPTARVCFQPACFEMASGRPEAGWQMARSIALSLLIHVSILYDSEVHPAVAVTVTSKAVMFRRAEIMT